MSIHYIVHLCFFIISKLLQIEVYSFRDLSWLVVLDGEPISVFIDAKLTTNDKKSFVMVSYFVCF